LVAINKEVKQRQQSENTVDTLLDIASEWKNKKAGDVI
jgi:hypothetical protein